LPGDRVWLVSPVYFDVESYTRLRENARAALPDSTGLSLHFVAIDDTAGADPAIRALEALPDQLVITPPFPLGHQRGLVFGLRRLSTMVSETDLVVTLDADGEDKPEDLPRLLAPLRQGDASLRTVVVAARTRRRESPWFKVFYILFKTFFQLLTGTIIRSGNYAAYRGWLTHNVLFHPHFDLSYSSSLLSLGLNVQRVPCERGVRYAGASKMTYVKLIQHGLRMLMPFADRIATRGLVIFSALLGLGLLGTGVLFVLEITGTVASPGWIIYTLCTGTLLCALAAACMVIVFALFVQSQSLSLARLDVGLRAVEPDGQRSTRA
jgi:polyisoprenyl-phosphate glycosyltransferase